MTYLMSIVNTVLNAIGGLPLVVQVLFFVIALNIVIATVFYVVMRFTEKEDVIPSKHSKR